MYIKAEQQNYRMTRLTGWPVTMVRTDHQGEDGPTMGMPFCWPGWALPQWGNPHSPCPHQCMNPCSGILVFMYKSQWLEQGEQPEKHEQLVTMTHSAASQRLEGSGLAGKLPMVPLPGHPCPQWPPHPNWGWICAWVGSSWPPQSGLIKGGAAPPEELCSWSPPSGVGWLDPPAWIHARALVVNDAIASMGVQTPLQDPDFRSFDDIPKSENAG